MRNKFRLITRTLGLIASFSLVGYGLATARTPIREEIKSEYEELKATQHKLRRDLRALNTELNAPLTIKSLAQYGSLEATIQANQVKLEGEKDLTAKIKGIDEKALVKSDELLSAKALNFYSLSLATIGIFGAMFSVMYLDLDKKK